MQIVGQKGIGALRKLASLKYLGMAKNLSKGRLARLKKGVNSKGNMRGVNIQMCSWFFYYIIR